MEEIEKKTITPATENIESVVVESIDHETVQDSVEQNDNNKTSENSEIDHPITVNPLLEELSKIDFKDADRSELIDALDKLTGIDDHKNVEPILRDIKDQFDLFYNHDKKLAQQTFEDEGHEDDEEFKYIMSDEDKVISNKIKSIQKKRNQYFASLNGEKEVNYKKKEQLLEKLRDLLNNQGTQLSVKAVKEIQEAWKNTGPVPNQYSKTQWANFSALVDRFYNNKHIDYEINQLNRKKNLELKLELCKKVEVLSDIEDVMIAIKLLDDYHQEFKHIGPVPREEQETLWNKFKEASSKIQEKRQEHYDNLKAQMEVNYDNKKELLTRIEEFLNFESDRINDWNSKTKELVAIQKEWESIGSIPRKVSSKVNRTFWSNLKIFFKNKNEFFKSLEKDKEGNLAKKQELVNLANDLKDHEDFEGTINKFKDLQAKWKTIGRAPEKYQNSIYKEFKEHCDHFFNRRKALRDEQEKEFVTNLEEKRKICDQIDSMTETSKIEIPQFMELIEQFNSIGFVPRNEVKVIRQRFKDVTSKFLSSEGISEAEKQELLIRIQVYAYKGGSDGDQVFDKIGQDIRTKISNIESDINNWENNLSFFASSATVDKLKEEFGLKIEASRKEIKELRQQLTLLRKLSSGKE